MSKFDKKVQKYIAKRHEDDLDVADIAIGLRLDDDAVLEALGSLKDQGRIESFARNGKTYWRLSTAESEPAEEANPQSIQGSPGAAAMDLDQAIAERRVKSMPEKMKPVEFGKIPQRSAPVVSTPKTSFPDIDNEDNDMDLDRSPKLLDSPVARIALAVMLSVAISAGVSTMMSGGSQKGFSDGFQALERKSTEKNAELEKRIAEVSAQVGLLNDKFSTLQQPRGIQQPRTEKSPAPKPSHLPRKKRATPKPSSVDENGASEPSGSDQTSPPASSGQNDNPAPESPSSTEGTGQ
jgi:hypothetical protein